jgi:hypothetical protein
MVFVERHSHYQTGAAFAITQRAVCSKIVVALALPDAARSALRGPSRRCC